MSLLRAIRESEVGTDVLRTLAGLGVISLYLSILAGIVYLCYRWPIQSVGTFFAIYLLTIAYGIGKEIIE